MLNADTSADDISNENRRGMENKLCGPHTNERAISASISDWFEIEIDYLPACRLSSMSNLRPVLIFLPYNWPASCRQHWIVPDDCVSARLADVLVFLEEQSSEIVSRNMLHWNFEYVIAYRVEVWIFGHKTIHFIATFIRIFTKIRIFHELNCALDARTRVISKWNSKCELVSHKIHEVRVSWPLHH